MHHLRSEAHIARAQGAGGPQANKGIGFPRLYDLLLLILTRGRDRAYREDLLDLAGLAPGFQLLDVGCGTGTQAISAWRRVQPGGSVVGLDVSEKMLAAARRKASRAGLEIPFHHSDAAKLPFEDGRFDVVTFTTVLHMVPEARRGLCLREAARVLPPGGRLLLIDYAGPVSERRHASARHGRHGQFDLDHLRGPLAEAGFERIEGGPLNWLGLHFLRAIRV
ncbi:MULTISPECIES: class I SAM-dependent methyltransferase [unclassified Mesorhizobium]|uniref:class I SAM-dependent methyltransferase n=1 Tax=unclassified Mesorhizobium TaxID=325217 RepID=UPI0011261FB3|nr:MULTISPECIES: methyltransferase domain-containing protein [unclassified Mesorhizobium]MBZ9807336.1 methyltransferase domain-containing protein [Mesorhizobium sp. ESP-6-2]TPM25226.1 methyltransferase domain-containing protein [Mesorhizobium sp. B2-2-2]